MITTRVVANTSIMPHSYHFFFIVRTFKIYPLSNFQVYNTVLLTAFSMLYIKSLERTHDITERLYPFDGNLFISLIPTPNS